MNATFSSIRHLGLVDYPETYAAMRRFTHERQAHTPDELWLCEHPPTFTLGLAGRPEHLLRPSDIAVVQTDRGGQVTYHGPGQVVAYPLVDLKRQGYYVKEYVYRLEEAVIRSLMHWGVTGHRVRGAPGIYVRLDDPFAHTRLPAEWDEKALSTGIPLGKIAALGLKVSQHRSYHGLALNVAMDLAPYTLINPCGYAGLASIDLSTIGVRIHWAEAAQVLSQALSQRLLP